MTKSGEIQATITGAFILVLILQLSKEDQKKGSVIRLKERLMSKLKKQPKEYSKLADEAYNEVATNNNNKELELDIGIVIEGLVMNKIAYMQELFGMDIGLLVSRCSAKVTLPNLTREQGRNSWDITDELKEAIEKHSFEYLKDK